MNNVLANIRNDVLNFVQLLKLSHNARLEKILPQIALFKKSLI